MIGWWLSVAKNNSPQRSMSVVWRSSLYAGMCCVDMHIPVVGELISRISTVSRYKVSCVTGCGIQYSIHTYVDMQQVPPNVRTYMYTVCNVCYVCI